MLKFIKSSGIQQIPLYSSVTQHALYLPLSLFVQESLHAAVLPASRGRSVSGGFVTTTVWMVELATSVRGTSPCAAAWQSILETGVFTVSPVPTASKTAAANTTANYDYHAHDLWTVDIRLSFKLRSAQNSNNNGKKRSTDSNSVLIPKTLWSLAFQSS